MSDKQTKILGWLGTTLSILMYSPNNGELEW